MEKHKTQNAANYTNIDLEVRMAEFRIQRIGWATGAIVVALFGLGLLFASVLPPEPYPSPFGPPFGPSTEIERYFNSSRTQVRVMSFLYSVAAVMLIIFTSYLAALVRRTTNEAGVLFALTLGGGVTATAFLQLSALCLWVLARPETVEVNALLHTMHDLAYLTGGPAHVLSFAPFAGASSLALLKGTVLPRWIVWAGLATAVLSILSVAALLWEPATLILPLGRLFAFVWIFFISVVLTLRGTGAAETQMET